LSSTGDIVQTFKCYSLCRAMVPLGTTITRGEGEEEAVEVAGALE
jgi:hypothetical protein